ncbi:hypothetical protein XENOCAPTIV_016518 [Xenoophorus captivus]|uniref:Uncharacterized protein n=1 Tax=Xenoophorus captivus TaxID=1517983 RepID=A0ABV0QJU5_9TELE
MTPGKGETKSRKPSVSNEATEERLAGGKAQEDLTLSRSKAELEGASDGDHDANSDTFNFKKFQRCLLKPALGRDNGRPTDPRTNDRREKVKEKGFQPWHVTRISPVVTLQLGVTLSCCSHASCYMVMEASEDKGLLALVP